MSSGILVTIGINAYNAEKYLHEALESALQQTHREIEVLLYNDGSTDGTLDVARRVDDPRLTVFDAGRNSGLSCGRQVLKTLARGEYLTWLDADDRFLPGRVEQLLRCAEQTGADLVTDQYRCLDEAGNCLDTLIEVPDFITADPHFTRLFERNRMLPHPLIRRRCYRSVDYDTDLDASEDYDYWLKCSWEGYSFARLDQALLEYRLVPGSLSSDHERNLRVTRTILQKYPIDEIVKIYRQRGYPDELTNSMACLQLIFRQELSAARDFAKRSWLPDAELDRDFYLGTLELKLGDIGAAEKSLKTHLLRVPDSPAGLNNLGVLRRLRSGDGEDHFQKALALFPPYADARRNLENPDAACVTMTQLRVNAI